MWRKGAGGEMRHNTKYDKMIRGKSRGYNLPFSEFRKIYRKLIRNYDWGEGVVDIANTVSSR